MSSVLILYFEHTWYALCCLMCYFARVCDFFSWICYSVNAPIRMFTMDIRLQCTIFVTICFRAMEKKLRGVSRYNGMLNWILVQNTCDKTSRKHFLIRFFNESALFVLEKKNHLWNYKILYENTFDWCCLLRPGSPYDLWLSLFSISRLTAASRGSV